MAVFMCKPRTVDAVKYKGDFEFDSYPDWLLDLMRTGRIRHVGAHSIQIDNSVSSVCQAEPFDYVLHNLSTGENSTATKRILQRDYMPVVVGKGEE
ncbi:hypothetical protein [Alloscardovia sp. HMSC034E08]|uniref:hypothetical protein n=1 Tax=Alloscardovia sp. HMSC034E08 TaxID=1739413 RepID=UPI0008C53248|nr:hypothetical protein [Alloscardovia sp. HMSC034E08]OFQ96883.1 hypothetical protein HMPREF2909_00360 [Alloscardovia sp. HMSC034E08]